MEKAIRIGEGLGLSPDQSSNDHSYLVAVRSKLEETQGRFSDLAYVQKLIDRLEAA